MLVVLHFYLGELGDVYLAGVVLEDVEVVPLLLVAQQVLHVLVVDLEVAEVEFVAAFEEPLQQVLVAKVCETLLMLV